MKRNGTGVLTKVALSTALWAIIPTAGVFLFRLAVGRPSGGSWGLVEVFHPLPACLGLFLPFAAFAGGIAAGGHLARRRLTLWGLTFSVLAYVLLAFVTPVVKPRPPSADIVEAETGLRTEPTTPGRLIAWRARVTADPPDRFSFSINRPLESPPNWLTFLLHNPAVLAIFALFAVFLGQQVGFLTSGLSPPARQNTRWFLGLLTSIAFFMAVVAGEDWVRADPSRSGILGAWVPLIIPLVELGLLVILVRRRRTRLHASSPQLS